MFAVLAVALVLAASTGCGTKLERPPIEITYRQSLVGAGNIVRLKNQSDRPLHALEIKIRAASGDVAYHHDELPAYEVLEVGWKKLGGFEIPADARVEVRAKGYLLAVTAELGASAAAGKGGAP